MANNTFSKSTTAIEIANLYNNENWSNRVVMITGSTNGIGFETLRGFASMKNPPILITANRNIETSKEKSKSFQETNDKLQIHHLQLDLSSIESVKKCINDFNNLQLSLNVLVLNAGVFLDKYSESVEGYEKHFAINHLGHFILANGLLNALEEGSLKENKEFLSRIVVVASHSHYKGEINFKNFPLTIDTFGSAVTQKAYAQSKLCNVLFANELNRRMMDQDKPIRVNSLHPATMTNSNLGNESGMVRFVMSLFSFFTRTLEQAASTSLYCSLSPDLEGIGGKYYDVCKEKKASDSALDENLAKKLWEVTEEIAGKHL